MLDGVVDQAGPGALAARWRRTCRRPGFGVLQSDKGWSPALEHATVPVSADSHSDRRRPVVRIEDLVLAQWGWQDPGCWLLTLQTRTGQGCAQHTPPRSGRSQICAVLNLDVTALKLLRPLAPVRIAAALEGRTLPGTSDTEDRNVDPRDDLRKPATNVVQIREVIHANPRTLVRPRRSGRTGNRVRYDGSGTVVAHEAQIRAEPRGGHPRRHSYSLFKARGRWASAR